MDRFIVDKYQKERVVLWDLELESAGTQEFNRKVLAVNNMYGWLYEKGILEKISFEFKDYSDVTYFAFDTKALFPFRKEMEQSSVEDAAHAVQHIFDEEYTPCKYCGAIQLSWPMASYRDVDGCVGRSWESRLVQALGNNDISDLPYIAVDKGTKEAVKVLFERYGFEPSDIIKVRYLTENDRVQVELLDKESGNDVSWGIDSEEYAWGIFVGSELVGYCTLGGADDVDMGYDEFEDWNNDSLLLSDVRETLEKGNPENESVFLTLLDDRLSYFYEKLGFEMLEGGSMVRVVTPGLDDVIHSCEEVSKNEGGRDNSVFTYRDER